MCFQVYKKINVSNTFLFHRVTSRFKLKTDSSIVSKGLARDEQNLAANVACNKILPNGNPKFPYSLFLCQFRWNYLKLQQGTRER